jgi:hypothetical protein
MKICFPQLLYSKQSRRINSMFTSLIIFWRKSFIANFSVYQSFLFPIYFPIWSKQWREGWHDSNTFERQWGKWSLYRISFDRTLSFRRIFRSFKSGKFNFSYLSGRFYFYFYFIIYLFFFVPWNLTMLFSGIGRSTQ